MSKANKTVAGLIGLELLKAGVAEAKIEFFGAEGWQVRVGSVADVFRAEAAAKVLAANYGVEVLVAF
jgi:accessory colonization factor AcfC